MKGHLEKENLVHSSLKLQFFFYINLSNFHINIFTFDVFNQHLSSISRR